MNKDNDNDSLSDNDNPNDGDVLVPPRRIEFQQKFDARLANAESNYARNSIEMNNFTMIREFFIHHNEDAVGLEDLMNQPNANYMRTFMELVESVEKQLSTVPGGVKGEGKWRGTNHL
eukprot:scaffold15968_cov46-Cyclotella_meneghiniana.AAC.6